MDQAALLATLTEIAERGGSAQAHAARELIEQIAVDVPCAMTAAQQLADGYLNDPYLTRNPGDR